MTDRPGLTIPINVTTVVTTLVCVISLAVGTWAWTYIATAAIAAHKVPDIIASADRIEAKLDAILDAQGRTNSRLAVLEFAVMGEVSEPVMVPLEGGGD